MIRVFLLLVAAVTALATAQTIAPANFTSSTADLKAEDGLMLWLTEGPYWVPIAAVLPLTTAAKTIPKTVDLSGTVRVLTASSDIVPKPDDICVISCDSSPGYFSPLETFNQAQTANVSAVLFYTIQADYCNLEGYAGSYPWIYSMKSQNNTATLLNVANTPDPDNDGAVGAAIEYSDQTPESAGAGNSSTGPLGPSPTTAVAMIILYSVTGVITILFLVIILSGAIRAHRHPERYGPRNAVGGPRQSRAKGLARAMLDTLPIVKFSQRNTPKPTDIELAENVGAAPSTTETTEMPASQTPARDPRAEAQEDNATRRSMEGGIAAATNLEQSQSGDNLGCSICTEDFEDGQDQRVLPCDHRFHPECVDPWLLNVSGTCPLCRIDLRPAPSTSDTMPLDDNGEPILGNGSDAPPLGLQGTAGERQRMTIRRSIMIGIMGVGRLEVLSQEERLYALRRLRRQRLVLQRREEQAAVAETPEEESRARRMLRGFARRRTTVASSNAAPEQPSSEIASVANGHGQG